MKQTIWQRLAYHVRMLRQQPIPRKVTTAVASWWEWAGFMSKPIPAAPSRTDERSEEGPDV